MERGRPAGFFDRFAAMAIELSLFSTVQGALFQVWMILAAPFGGNLFLPLWPWSVLVCLASVTGALAWSYRWKRSPGMVILDLALIDAKSGGRPNVLQCGLKALIVILNALAGMAFVIVFFIAGAPHSTGPTLSLWFSGPAAAFCVLLLAYVPIACTTSRRSAWDYLTRTAVVRRSRPIPAALLPDGANLQH